GLRHAMPTEVARQDAVHLPRRFELPTQDARRNPGADGEPRCVDRLVTVVGLLAGDALRPTGEAPPVGGLELEQADAPLGRDTRGNAERLLERQPNLPQRDPPDAQHQPAPAVGRSRDSTQYARAAPPSR